MIGYLLLLVFGWHRVPERFVTRGMEFLVLFLKDFDTGDEQVLPPPCLRALAQLAYRRAGKVQNNQPRFFFYVRELKRVSRLVHAALTKSGPTDGEIRSLLLWHGVNCFSNGANEMAEPMTNVVTPNTEREPQQPQVATSRSTLGIVRTTECPVCGRHYGFFDRLSQPTMCKACYKVRKRPHRAPDQPIAG
jgi:hypothetical protein